MRLKDRLVVVTGGSEGLGLSMAQAMAREGATVCLVGRSEAKLRAALQHFAPGQALTVAADVTRATDLQRLHTRLAALERPVDVLVNSAGVANFTPFEKVRPEDLQASFALNVGAGYFVTQALLPLFATPGASVIQLSSYFARKSLPGRPSTVYSLTKGAIDALTRSLAYELGPRGIRVNAIAPGTVDTPMRRRSIEALSPEAQADMARFVKGAYPLGRIGEPADLDGIAVFLASAESAWATGAVFTVDGGLTTG